MIDPIKTAVDELEQLVAYELVPEHDLHENFVDKVSVRWFANRALTALRSYQERTLSKHHEALKKLEIKLLALSSALGDDSDYTWTFMNEAMEMVETMLGDNYDQ